MDREPRSDSDMRYEDASVGMRVRVATCYDMGTSYTEKFLKKSNGITTIKSLGNGYVRCDCNDGHLDSNGGLYWPIPVEYLTPVRKRILVLYEK